MSDLYLFTMPDADERDVRHVTKALQDAADSAGVDGEIVVVNGGLKPIDKDELLAELTTDSE